MRARYSTYHFVMVFLGLWREGEVDPSVVLAFVFGFEESYLADFVEVFDVCSSVCLFVKTNKLYDAEAGNIWRKGFGHFYDAGDFESFLFGKLIGFNGCVLREALICFVDVFPEGFWTKLFEAEVKTDFVGFKLVARHEGACAVAQQ